MSLLSVENVSVHFHTNGGAVRALDDVSLTLERGETLAVVGESGCGKTTLARAILGLQPLQSGTIKIEGREVKGIAAGQAATVGMVWQDPFASLDPRWTIGDIVGEPIKLARQNQSVDEVLQEVGLSESMKNRYPHQLSGGQRQRVAIGKALALKPPLVICDEPTAALDLSMQAQILNLLRDIQKKLNSGFLYISHDLTTVRFLADRVAVMYLGKIVELGPAEQVFGSPMHPYTIALLESAPDVEKLGFLPAAAQGEIPDPRQVFRGCRFAGRCNRAQEVCIESQPIHSVSGQQYAECNFPTLKVGSQ